MTPMMRQILLNSGLVKRGLIGWWKCDEGIGTNLTDYSGAGHHGTFAAGVNAPTWGQGGIVFNGSQWITFPLVATLALEETATMQAVIKYTGSAGATYPRIISKDKAYGMTLNAINTGGFLRYYGNGTDVSIGGGLTQDTVVGIAESCTDSLITGYKNGSFLGSVATTNALMPSGNNLMIGNRADGTRGLIGTVYYGLLYNRDLTAKEIMQNHRFIQRELNKRGIVLP